MGLTMIVEAGAVRYTGKVDLRELEALEAAARHNEALRRAMELLFGGPDVEVGRRLSCRSLQQAIDTLLQPGYSALHSTIYEVVCSPMVGWPQGASSALFGARVGEELYEIRGGVDQCTLDRFRQDESGDWRKVASEDARGLKLIKSDNMGEIKIRKRSKANHTQRLLRRVRDALSELPNDSAVTVTLS